MTDAELFSFMDTFRSLARVFPLRGDEHEIRDVGASYFKALRRWPLKDINVAADRWLEQGKRFPKPAEWLDMVPRQSQAVALVAMTDEQAREHQRAESLRYKDTPCCCRDCVAVGVNDKPLRFVPDVNPDGTDRQMTTPFTQRPVTVGHWAHGAELARLYTACANFWNRCYELRLMDKKDRSKHERMPFEQRMAAIFARRPEMVAR